MSFLSIHSSFVALNVYIHVSSFVYSMTECFRIALVDDVWTAKSLFGPRNIRRTRCPSEDESCFVYRIHSPRYLENVNYPNNHLCK